MLTRSQLKRAKIKFFRCFLLFGNRNKMYIYGEKIQNDFLGSMICVTVISKSQTH